MNAAPGQRRWTLVGLMALTCCLLVGVAVSQRLSHAAPVSPSPQQRATQGPAAGAKPLDGLPVLEVPSGRATKNDLLAVLISGDGGWTDVDRNLAASLAATGVAVVGFNARAYLSRKRTPEQTATDLTRVIRYYMTRWNRSRVMLVGYARGANLAPFVANRVPDDLRRQIALVGLLGPARRASFEFHWTDLIAETSPATGLPIAPELERLRGVTVLCIYGRGDRESLCRGADTTIMRVQPRDGNGHYARDANAIARTMIAMTRT